MTWNTCYQCKCQMWIPDSLNDAALCSRGPSGIQFFCAYGHKQHYVVGESEETKLRRERDRLKQQTARLEDEAREVRARAEKAERATKRLKKRTAAGTCPCCQRTFSNMAEHMKHQHPAFVCDAGAKVVPIKRAKVS